jgi:hypothetical protein
MQVCEGGAGVLSVLREDGEKELVADPALQRMRAAVQETRAALERLRQQIRATEEALAAESRRRDDAERRRQMARDIDDVETARIAERFASRHAERAAVLERKVAVLGDEAGLLERDLAVMTEQLEASERAGAAEAGPSGRGGVEGGASGPSAGQVRTPSEEDEILRVRMERAAREKAAEDQLAALKRRMGK